MVLKAFVYFQNVLYAVKIYARIVGCICLILAINFGKVIIGVAKGVGMLAKTGENIFMF